MTRSTVFKTNRSQAVRLPKTGGHAGGTSARSRSSESANSRLISPADASWDVFLCGNRRWSDDFMTERSQAAPGGARSASDATLHARHEHLHLCHQESAGRASGEGFNRFAEQLCISAITLSRKLIYGAEKSRKRPNGQSRRDRADSPAGLADAALRPNERALAFRPDFARELEPQAASRSEAYGHDDRWSRRAK